MLTLARREGEKVMIGEDVVMEVIEVSRGRVRLGFTAPREVRIDREEVRQFKDNPPPADPK